MSQLFDRDKSVISRHIKNILEVINKYTKALDLLDNYDHRTLDKPKGHTNDKK